MMDQYRKRESMKSAIIDGVMPREVADKIVQAERPEGAGLKVQSFFDDEETTGGVKTASGGELVLYDRIDSWGGFWGISADEVRAGLDEIGEVENLTVRINSPGGEVTEGLTIHNLIADHPADVTVIVDGWFGDTSRMYVAGKVPRKAERLLDVTHEALMRGIEVVKPGNTFGDIGYAIQSFVEAQRMSVVRDFCGHGLGTVFHAPPNVLHYGRAGTGPVLEEGMFFTIEPMVNLGRPETKVLADDWTAVTRDKSLSAQFEHSIGVTADGCEIFTLSPADKFHPTW